MAKLRVGSSYWVDRFVGRPPQFAPLTGKHTVDVAVIGGGITGCLAAHTLAAAGARVALLEAARIGAGSTAASTALLMQEPDVDFRDLAARYGRPRTRRVWMQSARAVRRLTELLDRLEIRASLAHVPSVYWTDEPPVARDLQRELTRRHHAGIHGRWLSPSALRHATGLDGAGGILTRGNGQIDPYRACLGLAQRARAEGARIAEHSRARRVIGSCSGVQIDLHRAQIHAGWVVIATGYATPEFKPLAGRFRMSNTYVIATAPISRALRRQVGLGDVMLWDTHTPYHYLRWTPDRRLLFGGQDEPRLPGRSRRRALERHARSLLQQLVAFFPALEGITAEYAWEGLFATTADGLPYIGTHRRYPRHLFALGYGGNGMTFAYLAAEIISAKLAGSTSKDDEFYGFGRLR